MDGEQAVVEAIDRYELFAAAFIVEAVAAAIGEFIGSEACLNATESMCESVDEFDELTVNVGDCNKLIDGDVRRDWNGIVGYD